MLHLCCASVRDGTQENSAFLGKALYKVSCVTANRSISLHCFVALSFGAEVSAYQYTEIASPRVASSILHANVACMNSKCKSVHTYRICDAQVPDIS
jgi:hypothetical protein